MVPSKQDRAAALPYHITMLGSVHPPATPVTIDPPITLGVHIPEYDFKLEVDIRIAGAQVQLECYANKTAEGQNVIDIYKQANILVNSLVDIAAFSSGSGAYVLIDHLVSETGLTKHPFAFSDPALAKLSTSCIKAEDCIPLLYIVVANPPLLLALNDLVRANFPSDLTIINCARAVEGIRNLIGGSEKDAPKAWAKMRAALNVDTRYLKLITDNSTEHRHGNWVPIEARVRDEVLRRSWAVMDRYFHLLLKKLTVLPEADFPVLTG
jgi:hypothetical protein